MQVTHITMSPAFILIHSFINQFFVTLTLLGAPDAFISFLYEATFFEGAVIFAFEDIPLNASADTLVSLLESIFTLTNKISA